MPEYTYNRHAHYEYEILDKYEAGLALSGFEVKSIRSGHISLQGAYVVIKNREAFLINANVPAYQSQNTPAGYEPTRSRKLLLHRAEISSLIGKTKQPGLTLVPLRVYTKSGKLKLEFALARGKKAFDKREKIKKREFERQKQRILKGKE
ncbi:SsrA-binding protein SmpB [Patescibacteria group bacterium]|nr:SsrA-binding protein SmpB [Patescibacteria group bacterium]